MVRAWACTLMCLSTAPCTSAPRRKLTWPTSTSPSPIFIRTLLSLRLAQQIPGEFTEISFWSHNFCWTFVQQSTFHWSMWLWSHVGVHTTCVYASECVVYKNQLNIQDEFLVHFIKCRLNCRPCESWLHCSLVVSTKPGGSGPVVSTPWQLLRERPSPQWSPTPAETTKDLTHCMLQNAAAMVTSRREGSKRWIVLHYVVFASQ